MEWPCGARVVASIIDAAVMLDSSGKIAIRIFG